MKRTVRTCYGDITVGNRDVDVAFGDTKVVLKLDPSKLGRRGPAPDSVTAWD